MIKTKRCAMCEKNVPLDGFARDKNAKYGRGYYCRGCQRIRTYRDRDKRKIRAVEINYRLSKELYMCLVDTHKGLCGLCNKPETKYSMGSDRPDSLCIDHCHKTGKIRGLLCSRCNKALGIFSSIKFLKKAIKYLRRNPNAVYSQKLPRLRFLQPREVS